MSGRAGTRGALYSWTRCGVCSSRALCLSFSCLELALYASLCFIGQHESTPPPLELPLSVTIGDHPLTTLPYLALHKAHTLDALLAQQQVCGNELGCPLSVKYATLLEKTHPSSLRYEDGWSSPHRSPTARPLTHGAIGPPEPDIVSCVGRASKCAIKLWEGGSVGDPRLEQSR